MDIAASTESQHTKELQVLDYELQHLQDNRKLYLNQPNSNLYFLCSKPEALSHLEKQKEKLSEMKKKT